MFKTIARFLLKVSLFLSMAASGVLFFSSLSSIHGKEMDASEFTGGNPTIINLLNSEIFMGIIFVVTLGIFAYVSYLLWQLHEIAVHESEHKNSAHTTLVFALSLCGLLINKVWWVLAIIIAFTRWDVVGNALSRVISNGVHNQNMNSDKE
ncbi:magnesium transporter [Vibrio amylolyticus]|uniref:magnesium transporter n=1 Tax=Vibrio amylolyticus TaxID=2847292 RepID=UPI00354AE910